MSVHAEGDIPTSPSHAAVSQAALPRPGRVGVLTFHRCMNYGSYWQARRLVEGLRTRGLDAVLLDHHSARVNRAEWRCALAPLPRSASPLKDQSLYARKARRFFQAIEELPKSRRFSLESPSGMGPFDLVIIGSDEVWNLRHPWYAGSRLFFGEGLEVRRLAAYAASFGNYDADEGLDRPWAARLDAFDDLSVRDENSRRIVQRATGRDIPVVLDPCLQFASPPATDAPGDRLLVYGHGFPAAFQQKVRQAARTRGLRLTSIGYRNDWADDQWLDAGPEAFAAAMSSAAGVATNFFHGCVFAIAHSKPFVCAAGAYRRNKISSLVALLQADLHLVSGETPFASYERLLTEPIGEHVLARIAELRKVSTRYLDHVLAA